MENNKKHYIVVAIAALLMGGSVGLNINSAGIYLRPVSEALNIPMGTFSLHSTLITVGIAVAGFLVPKALEKVNLRLLILLATIGTAGTTFLMSLSTQAWQFNILGFLRGATSAFYGIILLQLLINNWFHEKNGLMTSIVFSFSGIVGAVFSPVLSSIIEGQGWQTAYMLQALFFVLMSVPAFIVPFKFSPTQEDKLPFGGKAETTTGNETNAQRAEQEQAGNVSLMTPTFMVLIVISILVPALTGMAQHLAPVGETKGFAASVGALMISASMAGNIIFKLGIGVLSDIKSTAVSVSAFLVTTIAGLTLLLIGGNNIVMIVGSFLFGAIFSLAVVGLNLLGRTGLHPSQFTKALPIINFIGNLGAAIGVTVYGYAFDFAGSYNPSIIVSMIAMAVVTVLVVIFFRENTAEKA